MNWYYDIKDKIVDVASKIAHDFSSDERIFLQLGKAKKKLDTYLDLNEKYNQRLIDSPPLNPINLSFVVDIFIQLSRLSLSRLKDFEGQINQFLYPLSRQIIKSAELIDSLKQEILALPIEKRALPIFIMHDMLWIDMKDPLLSPAAIIGGNDFFSKTAAMEFAKEVVNFRNCPPLGSRLDTYINYAVLCKYNNMDDVYEYLMCDAVDFINFNVKSILIYYDVRVSQADLETSDRITQALLDACLRKDVDTIKNFLRSQNKIIPDSSREKFRQSVQRLDDEIVNKFIEYIKNLENNPKTSSFYSVDRDVNADVMFTDSALDLAKDIPDIQGRLKARNLTDEVVSILSGWSSDETKYHQSNYEFGDRDDMETLETKKIEIFADIAKVLVSPGEASLPEYVVENFKIYLDKLKEYKYSKQASTFFEQSMQQIIKKFPKHADRFYELINAQAEFLFSGCYVFSNCLFVGEHLYNICSGYNSNKNVVKFAEKFNDFILKNNYNLAPALNKIDDYLILLTSLVQLRNDLGPEVCEQSFTMCMNLLDAYILNFDSEKIYEDFLKNIKSILNILKNNVIEQESGMRKVILSHLQAKAYEIDRSFLQKIDPYKAYVLHATYNTLIECTDNQEDKQKYKVAINDINYFSKNQNELLFVQPGMLSRQANMFNPQEITYNLEGLLEGAGDKEDQYIEQFTSYCLANPNCLNDFLQQTNSLQAREEYKAQLSKLKLIIQTKGDDFKFIGNQQENNIDQLLAPRFSACIKHPVIMVDRLYDLNELRDWFKEKPTLTTKGFYGESIKPGDISNATFLAEFVKYIEPKMKELKVKQGRDVRAEATEKLEFACGSGVRLLM